jgi:hypothetical protein
MLKIYPHAEATYRVMSFDNGSFGVEVSIPASHPTHGQCVQNQSGRRGVDRRAPPPSAIPNPVRRLVSRSEPPWPLASALGMPARLIERAGRRSRFHGKVARVPDAWVRANPASRSRARSASASQGRPVLCSLSTPATCHMPAGEHLSRRAAGKHSSAPFVVYLVRPLGTGSRVGHATNPCWSGRLVCSRAPAKVSISVPTGRA